MKPTKLIGYITAVSLAATPIITQATITCDTGRSPVTIHIGVNPTVSNLPPRMGLPGAATASINNINIQWVAIDPEERVCASEATTTNYIERTQRTINISDTRTGFSAEDIADIELLPTSNFTTGQIDISACMPDAMNNGLIFPLYGDATSNVGFQTVPFKVVNTDEGRVATAVTNEGTSDQVGLEFNVSGADQILQNISIATDTPLEELNRCIAENIYQETLILQFEAELQRMALFNNPTDGIIHSDKFIVTGSSAAAYVPHGVTAVFDGNTNVLSGGRVTSIDNKIDTSEHLGALRMRVKGYSDRTVTILEGRTSQAISVTDCATTSRIRSSFDRNSTLEGIITLYKNDQVVTSVSDDLNEIVNCDASQYQVIAQRVLDGVDIPVWTSNVYTLFEATQVAIMGMDTDSNGVVDVPNINGTLASVIELQCGESFTHELIVDPAGTYSWSDNAASWADTTTGQITGTPSCDSTGDFSFSYTVTGDNNSDSVVVNYRVLAEPVQIRITGLDTNNDGVVDVTNVDGALASTIELACDTSLHYDLIVEPAGSYAWSSNAAAWASVDSDGHISGTPRDGDCDQTITYTYTVTGPDNIDTVDVTYHLEEHVQYEILGVSWEFDNSVENPNINGIMDRSFAAACKAPGDYQNRIVREPTDLNINISGKQDWMTFSEVTGNLTFNPDCVHEGRYNLIFQTGNSDDAIYTINVTND